MSVAFENIASDIGIFASSLSFAATTTGSDRAILVTTGIDSATIDVTAITYDGDSLSIADRDVGSDFTLEIWELANPSTGSNTLSVTWNGSDSNAAAGAFAFSGVDQTTPSDGFQGANGTSSSPSVTVTSKTDDFVLDSIMLFFNPTPGSGQTGRFSESSFDFYEGSTEPGASSVVMSWSNSSSDYTLVAINVRQVDVSRRVFAVT